MQRILFGNHPTQMRGIVASIDDRRYEASFAPLDAVDLARFDLVVPLRVEQIAAARAGRTVVPDDRSVALCDDKLAFNLWLIDAGFGDTVPTLLDTRPTVFPYIRKTRRGDFGHGCRMIRHPGEDDGDDHPDVFRQRAVAGADEYVLHLLRIGDAIRFHVAYRYDMGQPLGVRGAIDRPASITPADPGDALPICTAILDALDYQGTCCFNYKREEGALRILECNPRFGGSLVGVVSEYLDAHLAAL